MLGDLFLFPDVVFNSCLSVKKKSQFSDTNGFPASVKRDLNGLDSSGDDTCTNELQGR